MRSAAVMWRDRVAHGLSQAFQKRGLRGSALTDNGSAMTAAEIVEGLNRLQRSASNNTAVFAPIFFANI